MGKKTDERLRSPFGNLRLPCFLIFPQSKKATSFPLKSISRKRSLFYSLFISPTGAFP